MRTASPINPMLPVPPAVLAAIPSMRWIPAGSLSPKRARRAVNAPPVIKGIITSMKTFTGCRFAQYIRSRNRRFSFL
ncbi:hypothetical protein RRF57_000135 [Xylaria bambusicola]|uniref:Uncharacterized protein n=1 Tax=Xylaria bambusicola TaxID=326684 RepID=A0AAN7UE21_9PEZI